MPTKNRKVRLIVLVFTKITKNLKASLPSPLLTASPPFLLLFSSFSPPLLLHFSSPLPLTSFRPPPLLTASPLLPTSSRLPYLLARTFRPFRWQAGREEPRCKHFCRFLLAAGTLGSTCPPGITERRRRFRVKPGMRGGRGPEGGPGGGRRGPEGGRTRVRTKTRTGAQPAPWGRQRFRVKPGMRRSSPESSGTGAGMRGGVPARTPRPALLALFAGKRDAKNLVASIIAVFRLPPGR